MAITHLLRLPATGNEQDWDLELADKTRIGEFIDVYSTHPQLPVDQKRALIALILASCDDYLHHQDSVLPDNIWIPLSHWLVHEQIYQDLTTYWAADYHQDSDHHFYLTPYMQSIINDY